jgi:hypothetical protein
VTPSSCLKFEVGLQVVLLVGVLLRRAHRKRGVLGNVDLALLAALLLGGRLEVDVEIPGGGAREGVLDTKGRLRWVT